MFTGIVSEIGTVEAIERRGDTRFRLSTALDRSAIPIGASIACAGVCLTVIESGAGWIAVSASAETLAKTTLKDWRIGTRVNLERALRVGDELGGHLVSGHIDGVARVVSLASVGDSRRVELEAPGGTSRFIAPKGSIALDGVSLTVNEVDGLRFTANLIPHTLSVTTFGQVRERDLVNLEIDMVARYIARLLNERRKAG